MSCKNNVNRCISCTVASCAHHCDSEDYCTLDKVSIGTHEEHPTMCECTDCKSFKMR